MPLRYLLCKGSNLTITPKQVQINQRSDLKITPVPQWLTRKKKTFFKFYCYHLKHLCKIKYHCLTRKFTTSDLLLTTDVKMLPAFIFLPQKTGGKIQLFNHY